MPSATRSTSCRAQLRVGIGGQRWLRLHSSPAALGTAAYLDELGTSRLGQSAVAERANLDRELVGGKLRMRLQLRVGHGAGAGLQVDDDAASIGVSLEAVDPPDELQLVPPLRETGPRRRPARAVRTAARRRAGGPSSAPPLDASLRARAGPGPTGEDRPRAGPASPPRREGTDRQPARAPACRASDSGTTAPYRRRVRGTSEAGSAGKTPPSTATRARARLGHAPVARRIVARGRTRTTGANRGRRQWRARRGSRPPPSDDACPRPDRRRRCAVPRRVPAGRALSAPR